MSNRARATACQARPTRSTAVIPRHRPSSSAWAVGRHRRKSHAKYYGDVRLTPSSLNFVVTNSHRHSLANGNVGLSNVYFIAAAAARGECRTTGTVNPLPKRRRRAAAGGRARSEYIATARYIGIILCVQHHRNYTATYASPALRAAAFIYVLEPKIAFVPPGRRVPTKRHRGHGRTARWRVPITTNTRSK